jgi:hypothetical protein
MVNCSPIYLSHQNMTQVREVMVETLSSYDLEVMEIPIQRPVLVIIGGASNLSPTISQEIQSLFENVLAPLAEELNAVVIDGGTDTGVMRLMGQARANIKGDFPLIGVAPRSLVYSQNEDRSRDTPNAELVTLEPNHTHFILVPGNTWGDESESIAQLSTLISGEAPSIVVMLNGGTITWKDARQHVKSGRILLAIDGTGRAADDLAAAVRGESNNIQGKDLVASGLVQVIGLKDGEEAIRHRVEMILLDGVKF